MPVLIAHKVATTHLFRIAQEAASNAVKHGQARRIKIDLARQGDKLLLTVRDDGKGFDAAAPKRNGMGLTTMKFRAQVIGGLLNIEPAADGGTIVTCTAPVSLLELASE